MQRRKPSPREQIGNLTRENAYGSFAELGRRLAPSLGRGGVSPRTAARYLREMTMGTREVPKQILSTLNRRERYFRDEVPRAQIEAATDIREKLDIAINSPRQRIDIRELMPAEFQGYAFDFQKDINSDPRFKYVKEALEAGLEVRIVATSEGADGERARAVGYISGTELIEKKPGSKTRVPRYISQIYHIFRTAYDKTGEASIIVNADLDDDEEFLI